MKSSGFFLLLILFLPTQVGFHFFPGWSFVNGIQIDYYSPTVYLSDILVLLFVISCFFKDKLQIRHNQYTSFLFFLLLYLLGNSLFVAENTYIALLKSFKVLELVFLGFCFYYLKLKNSSFNLFLSVGVIYSSLLGLLQFAEQRSINSLAWFLGERYFTSNSPGVSTFSLFGQEFVRVYSSFSHPNSLAGYTLLSLVLLYPWKQTIPKIALAFGVITLFLSFSQGAWLVFLLFAGWLLIKNERKQLYPTPFLLVVSSTLFFVFTNLNSAPQEIQRRIDLAHISWILVKSHPLAGVGFNNFIYTLPNFFPQEITWFFQPVHNIFLLIFSELGLVGLILFVWGLLLFSLHGKKVSFALWAIILTGCFDHYWLTLPQNQFLATLALVSTIKHCVIVKYVKF